MTEFIAQNPILALMVTIVPVAAVMWKVFHELYVKPRDFRIDLLKEDMARVSSQLDELRKLREGRVVTGQGHGDGSSRIEARPTDSTPLEKAPLPIVQPTQGSKTPADSLAVFYERWSDPSITELQKQKFERDWTGKDVRWAVSVELVNKASHGIVLVSVRDGPRDNLATPRAMLVFTEHNEEVLLSLQLRDRIVVTGKIREFFIKPMLDVLRVERA